MSSGKPLVLAFGDSLVAGYGLPPADGFAAQLERRLRVDRPQARVLNGGVSGDTTGHALQRLPRLLSTLARKPDLALVQVGPNDVLYGVPPARTRAQMDAILAEFGRCGIPVLLTTVTPPAFLRERAAAYIGVPDEVAARHGAVTCPFFPEGVLGRPDMVLADRIHPNARAIARVVEALLPTVDSLLRRADAA